jgi:3-phenylpropionate/cinnamic acid dioxygenase small subunit
MGAGNGGSLMAQSSLDTVLLHHEVYAFLVREAELVDGRRYEEWLELFTPDAIYQVPQRINRGVRQGAADWAVETEVLPNGVPFFNDTRDTLMLRVVKMRSARAGAENPPSRTRHFVGNVRISAADPNGALEVKTCLLVHQSRNEDDVHWYSAERTDVLRRVNDDLKIASRRVLLDSTLLTSGNISIFF